MSIYSNIDLETFQWVHREVEQTLGSAEGELKQFVSSQDKSQLYSLSNHLHQVVGSLQMLELKSLSSLLMESERLVEDFAGKDSSIRQPKFVTLLEGSFSALRKTFERIESGLPENPIDVVELINQIRSTRGLESVEISSLFSPMIDVFPEVNADKALKDTVYIKRAKALRVYFQNFMLQWLRDKDQGALDKIALVIDKMLQMSTFGSVARLWWVASAYCDYVKHNDPSNTSVHGRIFRKLDDRFRDLELQGESGLVRDPGEELIKLMLFYTGVGEKRTERMDDIVDAFKLQEYFPALKIQDASNLLAVESALEQVKLGDEVPLVLVRQLVTGYFESEERENRQLLDILEPLEEAKEKLSAADVGVVGEVVNEAAQTVQNMRRGLVKSDDDTGFHLASALMFVENSINNPHEVDQHWLQNGQLKLRALQALNNQEELTDDMDGTHLTGGERQALLDVVGNEVEENLKEIEQRLETFANDPSQTQELTGIDGKIRQVRGALQVLGEQKVGLLLKMAEEQFIALEAGEADPKPELIEALAISVGTMEAYVKGLQSDSGGMDVLLDRSITDLEVAIGKTVSRADVEELIDGASDSLFTWLGNQSDFDLFTKLKSSLRDLTILAKKTKLQEVELLVKEQDRLVDVISQEPAFLTDNITATLQNNMASIAEQIITLYGTEETAEEAERDEELAYKKSSIESEDEDAQRFHDEMDVDELGEEIAQDVEKAGSEQANATEIAKQHAAEQKAAPEVDESIFEVFIEESVEVLERANEQYEKCKSDLNDRTAIRELRRDFHTLKGSSRMVGLNDAGEVAWFSESLFNYVLDTEKPLTPEILNFAREALDEFESQVSERYVNQHLIDVAAWGQKTEQVNESLQDNPQSEPDPVPEAELVEDAPEVEEESQADISEETQIELEETEIEFDSISLDGVAENVVDDNALADAQQFFSEADVSDEVTVDAADESLDAAAIDVGVEIAEEPVDEVTLEDQAVIADGKQDDSHNIVDQDQEFSINFDGLSIDDIEEPEAEQIEQSETISDSDESSEEFTEAAAIAEFIAMDDDIDIIEYSSEIVIEEDSVIELAEDVVVDLDDFEDQEQGSDSVEVAESDLDIYEGGADYVEGVELDLESSSISIINHAEMREVFALEAFNNIEKLNAELQRDPILLNDDDPLSIALHTLLGNARTLGLDKVAKTLQSAETLCISRNDAGLPLSSEESEVLKDIGKALRTGIDQASDVAPYYHWNDEEWDGYDQALSHFLKDSTADSAELIEEPSLIIEELTSDIEEPTIEISESIEIEEPSAEEVEEPSAEEVEEPSAEEIEEPSV